MKSGEADEHQVVLVVLGVAQAARGEYRCGDREQAQAVLGVRACHVLGLRAQVGGEWADAAVRTHV